MSDKPIALTIAGSDSGGGAGIQADLKAMEANGVFGTSALAAVTAQNTEEVAQAHDLFPFVVDPVMISRTGFKLLQDAAIETLIDELLPLATVVTPNVHEAEHLTGVTIETTEDLEAAGKALLDHGPDAVLVKGGHLSGADEAVDVLVDGDASRRFAAPRINTTHTHGTGCTYASAIAANLAKGHDLTSAIGRAKRYVTGAIRHALPLGHGRGPTNHFFHLDPEAAFPEANVAQVSA